jgi:hypothetical protein
MAINIHELREKGRPLWMSEAGAETYADFLGGGGDIHTDRLAPEWNRNKGEEFDEEAYDPELAQELLAGRGCDCTG